MLHKKNKKVSILKTILIYPVLMYLIILILIFFIYMSGKFYFSIKRVYELNWNIKIPNIEKIILHQKEQSFSGDGAEVVVYLTDDLPDNYSSVKEKEVENAIKDIILKLRIEKQFYPEFSQTYQWKKYVKNDGYDIIYILFFPETKKVYLVKNSI